MLYLTPNTTLASWSGLDRLQSCPLASQVLRCVCVHGLLHLVFQRARLLLLFQPLAGWFWDTPPVVPPPLSISPSLNCSQIPVFSPKEEAAGCVSHWGISRQRAVIVVLRTLCRVETCLVPWGNGRERVGWGTRKEGRPQRGRVDGLGKSEETEKFIKNN